MGFKFRAESKAVRGNSEISITIGLFIDNVEMGTLTEKHTHSPTGNNATYEYTITPECDIVFNHHTRIFDTPHGCAGYTTLTATCGNEESIVTVHHF